LFLAGTGLIAVEALSTRYFHAKKVSVMILMNIKTISLAAIALFMSLALITAFSIAIPAALSSSGGVVPLVPVKTGNSKLDKEINKFYSCIKKTGHTGGDKPEPSRDEVNNCYLKVFTGSSGSSTITTSIGRKGT
jgi:hypothetical protein